MTIEKLKVNNAFQKTLNKKLLIDILDVLDLTEIQSKTILNLFEEQFKLGQRDGFDLAVLQGVGNEQQIRADVLKDVLEIVKDLEKRSINNHEWVFKELRKELKSKIKGDA